MTSTSFTEEVSYEARYCAFVDILGFRDLIGQLRDGEMKASRLRSLLTEVHAPHRFLPGANCDFRAQSISDAVALSTTVSSDGLMHLFEVLTELTESLLLNGYFVRGAVVRGKLYHDDKMVFGDGLVEAYRIEQEVAKYPRIVIPRQVTLDIRNMDKKTRRDFKLRVKQADDGPFFLHTLRRMEAATRKPYILDRDIDPFDDPTLAYYGAMGQKIQQRFDESVDNPRHFEKVQWFARYWNETLPQDGSGFARVKGAGLDPKPASWG